MNSRYATDENLIFSFRFLMSKYNTNSEKNLFIKMDINNKLNMYVLSNNKYYEKIPIIYQLKIN